MDNLEPFFEEGKEAYFAGDVLESCPYYYDAAIEWKKGFKAGEKMDVEQDPDGN